MPAQKNKAHKPGRRAGKSAREKHKLSKSEQRQAIRNVGASAKQSKTDRNNAAKQQRDQKREALLAKRRQVGAPRVVTMLPMSEGAEISAFWDKMLAASSEEAEPDTAGYRPARGEDESMGIQDKEVRFPHKPTLAALPGNQKGQLFWIPPPKHLSDPLVVTEVARHAEIVLLVFSETAELDPTAVQALTVLREFGAPLLVPVVLAPPNAPLKVRAACKKLAATAVEAQGLIGQKVHVTGNAGDLLQLLRHLGEASIRLPSWRQQRPSLLIEAARSHSGDNTCLVLRGFVRALGLSANQALHIPGSGDFLIDRIEAPERPQPDLGRAPGKRSHGSGVADMETSGPSPLLATANLEERESLQRENEPDPLDAEQTWPTEEELAAAAMDVETRTRRLPKGTSAYQAAWILDDDFSEEETEEVVLSSPRKTGPSRPQSEAAGGDWQEDEDMEDWQTSFGQDEDESSIGAKPKPSREDQEDDLHFPDEVDTPEDMPARQRFAKYRGLKSWRTSPWDPRESLPQEYGRIFAFQNIRRAEKRAKAAAHKAGAAGDPHGVPVESYVDVFLAPIDSEAASAVLRRVELASQGEAPPVTAFGLLQHETKLSVVNFAVKKAASFEEPLPNKAPLLLIAGHRSFQARPIWSADEHGANKFKMERFLQPGQNAMASIYAPITYGPLPMLAFSQDSNGRLRLAATGSLRSCDPDRVVLKRIVLSGFPVKVHKKKAVVRWMFHNPEDVRWFRPLELWTKHGLRGRIREPIGTHGSMKCLFDGSAKQQDAVCVSLYKRIFPKWPETMDFCRPWRAAEV